MNKITMIKIYDRFLHELLKWNKDGIGVKGEKTSYGYIPKVAVNFLTEKDKMFIKEEQKRLDRILSKIKS